jgi:effector-binding domain-containing protein
MSTLLVILVVIIAVPLLYLLLLDASFTVRRSLEINRDRSTVFDKLRDFKSWPDWSPWLMHEADTTLLYSENPNQEGGWYSWDGNTVGKGQLTHKQFTGQEKIEQEIEFIRPFKSVSTVWWELEESGENKTLVHWNITGRMPFFLRFLAKKMPKFIGKDYETGLAMLRGDLDKDAECPRLSFDGPVDLPAQTALTIPFEGELESLKKAMEAGYKKLGAFAEEHSEEVSGAPFTVYHKVDLDKMHFTCDMALPVNATGSGSEFVLKQLPGGRYYKTTLQGSYEFLELAWYQAYSHLRMQKIKPLIKSASLEVYENDPNRVTHTNEIITSILIPIK